MLSALICTKNESRNIKDCLEALSFADELIVIDDNSTDATVNIAKEAGAKVFTRTLDSDWAAQRNFGLKQCTGDWFLVVDADERIERDLARKIQDIVNSGSHERMCYQLLRENTFEGRRPMHGHLHSDWVSRLFPASPEVRYEGRVHERLVTPYPIGKIKGAVMSHCPYADWDAYYRKINRYAELMALENFERGKRSGFWLDILVRPVWAFFKMYVINKGFLDGKAGFIFAMNYYFYTMAKYVRLRSMSDGDRVNVNFYNPPVARMSVNE